MASQLFVLVGGIAGGALALVLFVWAMIAIRDPKSWSRKMFEYLPKILVSLAEGLINALVVFARTKYAGLKNSKKQIGKGRASRSRAASIHTDDFWDDDFRLPKEQESLYGRIVAAMPPQ